MMPAETIARSCAYNWSYRQTKDGLAASKYADEKCRDPSFLGEARGIIEDLRAAGFTITGKERG